jgi:hypothetical protein
MKTREVTLATGEKFTVPQGVQRLDSKSTKGWQVRYQGTKYFPDGEAGPQKALEAATRELLKRIAALPAPVVLKRAPSPKKTSTLPPGISGPILVTRRGSSEPAAVLSVLVPRFGATNTTRKIHIGTRSTYTTARFRAAVAKALEIRDQSLATYEAAATKAKRKQANEMKKALSAAKAHAA